jgi:prevent-host-death family protein
MAAAADGEGEIAVGVTAFRPRSLALIEAVASGRLRRVVLTKRGRPIAAFVPLEQTPK